MPSLPYNLFLNAAFSISIHGFVGKDGSSYGVGATVLSPRRSQATTYKPITQTYQIEHLRQAFLGKER
jgi:hypothetical protein